jgi:tetratricopeptide (TPR) repeat protein
VLSEAFIEKNELNRALDYCNRAYNLSDKLGAREIIATLKRLFGIIYSKKKKCDVAMENFKDSIKLLNEIGNNKELGESYYEYGIMLSNMKDKESAEENLKKAEEIFKKLKLRSKRDKAIKALERLK